MQVLNLLATAGGCVSAVISGHQHEGGHFTDPETGIHHIALQSPLLTDPGHPGPFMLLEAKDDCIILSGYGNCQSRQPGSEIAMQRVSLSLPPLPLSDAQG